MNFETELLTKLIPVIGSMLAFPKIINEYIGSRKSQLRDEFKFVKEFVGDLKEDTHPIVIEKGYQAFSGSSKLAAKEIRYLLDFDEPTKALKCYEYAGAVLMFNDGSSKSQQIIDYAPEFSSDNKRKWLTKYYYAKYMFFAFLAFAPISYSRDLFGTNWKLALIMIAMCLGAFGPLAFHALNQTKSLKRAEALLEMGKSGS